MTPASFPAFFSSVVPFHCKRFWYLFHLKLDGLTEFNPQSTCLSISPCLSMSLYWPLFLRSGPSLWSAAETGTWEEVALARRKARQTKLQQGFSRHAGSGAQRALCQSGGAPYSCGVLAQSHSHTCITIAYIETLLRDKRDGGVLL